MVSHTQTVMTLGSSKNCQQAHWLTYVGSVCGVTIAYGLASPTVRLTASSDNPKVSATCSGGMPSARARRLVELVQPVWPVLELVQLFRAVDYELQLIQRN